MLRSAFGVRSALVAAGLLSLIAPASEAGLRSPQPGDVYFETSFVLPPPLWRVTDPNSPNAGAQAHLPNPVLEFEIPPGRLAHAIRAELMIDRWGGHPGTSGQRVRVNAECKHRMRWVKASPRSVTTAEHLCDQPHH